MSLDRHFVHFCASLLMVCVACASAGCGSTVASSTGPSPTKCGVTVTPPAASIGSAGATATVAVSTQAECTWNASSEANWITGLTPASGQGTGEIKVNVAPNQGSTSRQGDVVVNGVRAQIRQEAASCRFELSAEEQTFDAFGGTARISVSTIAGCTWRARADAAWVTLSASTGTGPGAVTITVGANPGSPRSASVTIADQTVRISQDAKDALPPPSTACVYSVTPTAASVAATGGGATISLDTMAGCEWSATSNAAWLTITSDAHSFGPASVTFSAATNTGAARTGTLSVAGKAVTVTQAAASGPQTPSCSYTVNPLTLSLPSSGSTRSSFTVATASGCAWSAASNTNWITVTSGASGSGNGTVDISAAANTTTSARTGTLTIAGLQVTITEAAAACSYAVSPTSVTIGAVGGTGTAIAVIAGSGCTWTATSNVNWITLVTGQTGTGNGTVTYLVLANTGAPRNGTLTVAGQTVTVSQGSACAFTISPTSESFPRGGGTGAVTVTTQSGCAWTATSNANWITITSGASGTGSGSVGFTVAANTGPARTGTLTIAGSTFTVTEQKK